MAEAALIPAYLSLGLQALGPIVLGSFKSLKVCLGFALSSSEGT